MPNVGSAYVTLMPSMKGFAAGVNKSISGIDTTASGKAMGIKAAKGFSGGFASGGIIAGAAMAVATKAMDAVTASMDRAIKRVDTMQNFPKVMTNLGYSAQDAARNIQTMSDGLDGLPTSLDAMVSMVQQLTPLSSSMDEATQIGLAFNNMMLAGGASTQQQESALLQYTQALAKGKPELQDWRALQQVMPGQLDQVAKAMLGPTAKSMDLFEALKNGKVSMADFNQAILRLNTEGGNGFASFEQQARDATTGIGTAMDNMATRTAKGVATMIDAIGQENISGAINYLSSGIGDVANDLSGDLSAATGFVMQFSGEIKGAVDLMGKMVPVAIRVTGAIVGIKAGKAAIDGISAGFGNLTGRVNDLGRQALYLGMNMQSSGTRGADAMKKIGSAMARVSPAAMAGAAAVAIGFVAVIATLADGYAKAQERQKLLTQSTAGLTEATARVRDSISGAAGATRELSEASRIAKPDMDAFLESQAQHASNISTIADNLNAEMVSLNSAQQAIAQYAGQTDLTTQEQGRLQAAIEIVNQALGTNYEVLDAANGKISDSEGNYDEAAAASGRYKDAINEAIEAKKNEIRAESMASSLKEAYAAKSDAVREYTAAVADLRQKQQELADAEARGLSGDALRGYADAVTLAQKNVEDCDAAVKSADESVRLIESDMSGLGQATSASASAFQRFAYGSSGFSDMLARAGHSADDFGRRMEECGVSVEALQDLSSEQLATLASSFDGSGQSIVTTLAGMGVAIDGYNAKSLKNMYANVTLDDDELVDAQGNVYTWNGSELVDQYGNAVVDDKKLVDAQGKVWTWNATDMKWQDTGVNVDTAAFGKAKSLWEGTTFQTKWAKVKAVINGQNAAGGFIKAHATGGFITNGVTDLGLDRYGVRHIAGEDGHEWIMEHADGTKSVIPIENQRYLDPYADIIAAKIAKDGKASRERDGRREAPVPKQEFNIYCDDPELVCAMVAARQRSAMCA